METDDTANHTPRKEVIIRGSLYQPQAYLNADNISTGIRGGFIADQPAPGSYLDVYRAQLMVLGTSTADQQIKALEQRYALDRPLYYQYFKWITGFVRGDFGRSFQYNREVSELVWARIGFTVVVSLCSLIFSWAVAIPIGIYSATHKYSGADNLFIPVFHRAEHPEFSHCPCPDGYLIPGLRGIGRPCFPGLASMPLGWPSLSTFSNTSGFRWWLWA